MIRRSASIASVVALFVSLLTACQLPTVDDWDGSAPDHRITGREFQLTPQFSTEGGGPSYHLEFAEAGDWKISISESSGSLSLTVYACDNAGCNGGVTLFSQSTPHSTTYHFNAARYVLSTSDGSPYINTARITFKRQ